MSSRFQWRHQDLTPGRSSPLRRWTLFGALLVVTTASAGGFDRLDRLNRRLAGHVMDHTKNHGQSAGIPSKILGECRDVYVYLPPGYDPALAYPMVLWVHGAFGDEASFLLNRDLIGIDRMIRDGDYPPVIVVCADATYEGVNRLRAKHSFLVNGQGGRFEDFVLLELIPFLLANYAISLDRQAHAIGGMSAGAFAALSLAMKHPEFFSKVAALSGPINMRYWNTKNRYFAPFRPETYRWAESYRPKMVVGAYLGFIRLRAAGLIEPVFGPPECLLANVAKSNPADLLFTRPLAPGELEIYVNYCSHDNFNFDAQSESFAWLAEQVGVPVELVRDNLAWHKIPYFRRSERLAFEWLKPRLPAPVPISVSLSKAALSNGSSK